MIWDVVPNRIRSLIFYQKIGYCIFFLQFLIIKTLDPDPDSLKMLNSDLYLDPDSVKPDPHLCYIV
jgi:hypothetical protein